ncbi:hypothetical protein PR048_033594 [Dryococelus australis]|uniref:ethanolamine kinase n=1 Tax=Dryococelus australis TaxID=614101 RepID=A0ABQ9G0Q8_9NEOP|nr:hypothetical protein PR048_033594 [Dryococelus australis]
MIDALGVIFGRLTRNRIWDRNAGAGAAMLPASPNCHTPKSYLLETQRWLLTLLDGQWIPFLRAALAGKLFAEAVHTPVEGALQMRKPGSIPDGVTRIFACGETWLTGSLGVLPFPYPCIRLLLHIHLISPFPSLKILLLGAGANFTTYISNSAEKEIMCRSPKRIGHVHCCCTKGRARLQFGIVIVLPSEIKSLTWHVDIKRNWPNTELRIDVGHKQRVVSTVLCRVTAIVMLCTECGNMPFMFSEVLEVPMTHPYNIVGIATGHGTMVAERLACSPPIKATGVQSPARSPDFCMRESCQTMPLVSGFSLGPPISPTLSFRRCSILTSIIPIVSQDHAVKSRPNLFTRCRPRRYAPRLWATFTNGLVYEYVEGNVVCVEMCREPEVYVLVACMMAQIHRVDCGPTVVREPCLWKKLRQFLGFVPRSFTDPRKQTRFEDLIPSITMINEEYTTLQSELSRIGSPIVFCHNDLLLGNIIYNSKRGKVTFIDYEYADYNYQAFDIGNHFAEFAGVSTIDYSLYPSYELQKQWLRVYLETFTGGERKVTDAAINELYVHVNKFCLTAHFLWAVWALIQAEHSSIDFDFLG